MPQWLFPERIVLLYCLNELEKVKMVCSLENNEQFQNDFPFAFETQKMFIHELIYADWSVVEVVPPQRMSIAN